MFQVYDVSLRYREQEHEEEIEWTVKRRYREFEQLYEKVSRFAFSSR